MRFRVHKVDLRAQFGSEVVRAATPRIGFNAILHPFHSADPNRLAIESAWMDRLLER